ncbi:MAG TPA: amidohydrolase [Actinomycetes bacterium]
MAGDAELVFVGGGVWTLDPSRPWASAVAVRGGRIALVGSDAEAHGLRGPRTQVIDLRGRMLLPGFQDAHSHPLLGGTERLQCDLSGGQTIAEYGELIAAYAERHPEREWIVGSGWWMAAFPGGTPHRRELDALVPDRPVLLVNRDHHGAWVNSRALELAGITRDTADPADGRIERDADGEPSGALHEGAMDLVAGLAPPATERELAAGLVEGQAYLHSLGITAWQDAAVGTVFTRGDSYGVYLAAARRGTLTARVAGALWWDRNRDDGQLDELLERRDRAEAAGRFRAGTVKIMQDGVCEDFTAAMLDPYLDRHGRPTDRHGISFLDPEALRRVVTRLDREGFQVHVHAIGDRAVRDSLDAFEAARTAGQGPGSSDGTGGTAAGTPARADRRHHIAHIQVVHPADVPRFAALGVTANAQPLWACHEPQMTELTIPFLGPERSGWQYPFGDLVRAGARLACGSDWPVSSPDPLWGMHVAVNRTAPAGYADAAAGGEPFLPEQRVDLETAIAGYTRSAAFLNRLDAETGSIELGKLADLVVLDRNLFEQPAGEIADARVLLTMVGGQPVHEAPGL